MFKIVSYSKIGTVLFAVFHLLFFTQFLNSSTSEIKFLVFSCFVFLVYFPKTRDYLTKINFTIPLIGIVFFSFIFYSLKSDYPNYGFIIVSFVICLLYFKKLPFFQTLRENYKTKAISISLSWILLCVGFLDQQIDYEKLFPFLLSQFLFVWALTIPFDFADVESDEKNGTVNFFAHLNKKNALIILTVLLLFQLFVNLYFFKNNVLFYCLNFIQATICCSFGFKFIKNYWFGEIVELAFFNQWLLWLLFT